MPHYLVHLDDLKPDRFAVYSTIVDNLITETMTADQMLAWIKADDRYSGWLKPYNAQALIDDSEARAGGWYSDGMKQLLYDQSRYFYYHALGFCYVRLSDHYFTLEPSDWRE